MSFTQVVNAEAGRLDASIRAVPRETKWALQQEWREAFAPEVKLRTGKWQIPNFNWHAFSNQVARAVSGGKAESFYQEESASELILLPEEEVEQAIRWWGVGKPDFSAYSVDVLISPPGFLWTMVFTHEDDLGPYFSRREWHEPARKALGQGPPA